MSDDQAYAASAHIGKEGDMTTPLLDILTKGYDLPDGYDRLLLKATSPDLRTRDNFRWPTKGLVKVPKPKGGFTNNPCPQFAGDGLSLAKTAEGMAAGGYSPTTVLVVAVKNTDVIAEDIIKAKVSKCLVVDLIDGLGILRTRGTGANLAGADLNVADLAGANANAYTVWPDKFNPKKAGVVIR